METEAPTSCLYPPAGSTRIACATRSFDLSILSSTPVVSCIEVPGTVAPGSSGHTVLEALGGLDTLSRILHFGSPAQARGTVAESEPPAMTPWDTGRRDEDTNACHTPVTVGDYTPICDATQEHRRPCMYLRCAPGDIFSKFLKANRSSRNDILIRVSRHNGRIVGMKIVGLVVERFVFDGLCDFFCAPPRVVPRALHFDVEALLNEASLAPIFIPPPAYTRATSPQNYRLDDFFDYAAAAAAASTDVNDGPTTAPLSRLRRHRRRLDLRLRLAQAAHSTVSSETLRTVQEQRKKAAGTLTALDAPATAVRRRRRRRMGLLLLPEDSAKAEATAQSLTGGVTASREVDSAGAAVNRCSASQESTPLGTPLSLRECLPPQSTDDADTSNLKRLKVACSSPACTDASATEPSPVSALTRAETVDGQGASQLSGPEPEQSANTETDYPAMPASNKEPDSTMASVDLGPNVVVGGAGPGNWQNSEAFNAVARFNDLAIPCEPPAAALSVIPEPELLEAYHRLFNQRPIWLRPMLDLRVSLSASSWKKKPSLAHTCYCISDGPWRGALCRLGYDPRKDPGARIYQTIDFRDRYFRAISWRLPAKTSKSFLHTSYLRTLPPGLKSINGANSLPCDSSDGGAPSDSAVLRPGPEPVSPASMGRAGGPETMTLSTSQSTSSALEDELFFRIPPSRPSQLFQLCDVDEPGVQHLLRVVPPAATCTKKDGWFQQGFLSQVRDLMEMTVKKMRDSGSGSQRGVSLNAPPIPQDSPL